MVEKLKGGRRKVLGWLRVLIRRRTLGVGAFLILTFLGYLSWDLYQRSGDDGSASLEVAQVAAQANVLAALISAVVSVLTLFLLLEAINVREQQNSPRLAVFIEPSLSRYKARSIVVQNLGQGAAYDVTLSADPTEAGWREGGVQQYFRDVYFFQHPVFFIAPGAQKRIDFGSMFIGRDEVVSDTFIIKASYRRKHAGPNTTGYDFEEAFPFTNQEFEDLINPTPEAEKQTQALKDITRELRHLKQLSDYHLQVNGSFYEKVLTAVDPEAHWRASADAGERSVNESRGDLDDIGGEAAESGGPETYGGSEAWDHRRGWARRVLQKLTQAVPGCRK